MSSPLPKPTLLFPLPQGAEDAIPAQPVAIRQGVIPGGRPSALFGRTEERAAIRSLLLDPATTLLTVIGPGGVGKTRLSLQIAADLAEPSEPNSPFPDGVVFVGLAAIDDAAFVLPTIARAMEIRDGVGDEGIAGALRTYLAPRRMLLILDNLEQVIDAAEDIASLLAAAPGLRLLATSRRPVRIRNEREFPLAPLEIPAVEESGQQLSLADLEASPAVNLFVARAQAINPSFALSPANAAAIAELVRRLDGLPLALELAAARTRLLSPAALVAQLSDRLRVLTGGPRDAPPRQQTIRATVAWSYDLLTPGDGALFRMLSVFAGGASMEAIERVVSDLAAAAEAAGDVPVLDPLDSFDTIANLIDESLVRPLAETVPGEPRFGMLETIRAYGLEQLDLVGEATAARAAHVSWARAFIETAEPELTRGDQETWLNRIAAEHDNFRAALGWSISTGDAINALALSGSLWRFWSVRGFVSEGRSWLRQALDMNEAAPALVRARALRAAGVLAEAQQDYAEAIRHDEAALTIFQAEGDANGAALSSIDLANISSDTGNYDRADKLYRSALAHAEQVGNRWVQAIALGNLGNVAARRGDDAVAADHYERTLSLLRPFGDLYRIAVLLDNYGVIEARRGNREKTVALRAESLSLRQTLGDKWGIASSLINLAESEVDPVRREAMWTESLTISQEIGFSENEGIALFNLANLAWEQHDRRLAMDRLSRSIAIFRNSGNRLALAESLEYLIYRLHPYEPANAARYIGYATGIRDTLAAPILAEASERYAAAVDSIVRTIGAPAYDAAVSAGRTLSDTDAVSAAMADITRLGFSDSPAPFAPPMQPIGVSAVDAFPSLTAREREVLALIATGLSDREIATRLSISPKTAGNHVTNILGKLDVTSRAAATAIAVRSGIA